MQSLIRAYTVIIDIDILIQENSNLSNLSTEAIIFCCGKFLSSELCYKIWDRSLFRTKVTILDFICEYSSQNLSYDRYCREA